MFAQFSTMRREIATVLVGLVAIATHFVPGLSIDPLLLDAVAGLLAILALAFVENRIDGMNLTALARIAADQLIRDDNVIEAIRAARELRGDPPEPDLSPPPRAYGAGLRAANRRLEAPMRRGIGGDDGD